MVLYIIIIITIIIFYILNNYLEKIIYLPENFNSDEALNIDLVISRYNEDLNWTLEEPFNKFKYIVYNKGINDNFNKENIKEIIKLDNVGKCDHTYLYHIIKNYNNLADITVFLPGSVDLKYKKKIASKLLREIQLKKNAIFISLNEYDIKKIHYNFKLDSYRTKHKGNKNINSSAELKKSTIRPFGLWYQNMFGNLQINCIVYYGIFSIHKNDIIQHHKSRYEFLIKELSLDSNPEAGHFFERSWCAVFHPLKETHLIKYNKLT